MKAFLTSILLTLTLAFSTEAVELLQTGQFKPIPELPFADEGQLSRWATESSFGGGSLEKIPALAKTIFYSRRSSTSGRPTTEIVFWAKGTVGFAPKLVIPMQAGEFKVEVEEGGIRVDQWSSKIGGFRRFLLLDKAFFDDL